MTDGSGARFAKCDAKGTAQSKRVTLHGGVRARILFASLLLGFALSCANGGDGSPGAAGDDEGGVVDEAGADGPKGDAHGDAKTGDAPGGVSAVKACADNATSYCTQLQTCAPFLYAEQYFDTSTCTTAQTKGCLDALQAKGTGWTGDGLEACVAARSALDCNTFLHGKPQPKACLVTGGIFTSEPCRYDAQCGTAYCRYAAGASCGTCVNPGETGAPCTSAADCDGNLMCATAGTCQPPSSSGSLCDANHPCQLGLSCIGGACTTPGAVGATCVPANANADCDATQGLYCDTTTTQCKEYLTAPAGSTCGGAIPTVCQASGTCYKGTCVAAVADQGSCNTTTGQNCLPPDTCTAGTCALFTAASCAGDGG
jgi:hypothetical protein